MSAHTQVTIIGDRHVIRTDSRRAEAILLVLSGSTLQEVGDRFGLTRERIRQFLLDAGLRTSERQRFSARPMGDSETFRRGRQYWRDLYAARQARIRRAVRFLKLFAASHDRSPTHSELWVLLSGKPPAGPHSACSQIAATLGFNWKSGKPAARRVRALY